MQKKVCLLMCALVLGAFGYERIERDDFQVSGPDSNAAIYESRIFCDVHGNYTVFWSMPNSGSYGGFRIFARQFTAAHIARGNAFEITTSSRTAYWSTILADMNDSGYFAVAWNRENAGAHEILARRFEPDGTPFDASPVVMNDSTNRWVNHDPDVAINNLAHTLVAWRQQSVGSYGNTYAAFMNASLSQPGTKFLLDAVDTGASNPRIALSDNFRIVLVSNKGNALSLRGRLFGYFIGVTPITGEFVIKNRNATDPADVDMTPGGQFTVVYENMIGNFNDIYARRYDSSGTSLGAEIAVEYQVEDDGDRIPHIDYSPSGRFVVSWDAPVEQHPRIRIYNASGAPFGAAVQVYNADYHSDGYAPCACIDGNNRVLVALICDQHSLFVTPYTGSGSVSGPALRINELGTSAAYPDAAVGKNTGFGAVVWELYGQNGIQLQLLGYDYEKVGTTITVNGPGGEFNPAVAIDDTAFVFWDDWRSGASDTALYYQRYSHTGALIGSESRVNDLGSAAKRPAAAMAKGRVMAVWEDRRSANSDTSQIYGQLFNETGASVGGNFFISQGVTNGYHPDVDAASDTFVVVWARTTTSTGGPIPTTSSRVYMRMYNRNGSPLTDTVRVNTSGNGYDPKVCVSYYGTFAVAWIQTGSGMSLAREVYFQRFAPNGDTIGVNTRADTGATPKSFPGVAVCEGGIRLSWQVNTSIVTVQSRDFNMNNNNTSAVRSHSFFGIRSPLAAPALATGSGHTLLVWMNSNHTNVGMRDIWGEFSYFTGEVWAGVERPAVSLPDREAIVPWINPVSNQRWINPYDRPVSIFNIKGELIGRVGPEGAFQFPAAGSYFFRIGNAKVKKAVVLY